MFSVVICTRKRSEQLVSSVRIVSKYNPFEIIVVVNDCNESISALASLKLDNLVIVKNSVNMGAGPAKHQGIQLANSEKVLVLDDDAEVLPNSNLTYCLNLLDKYALVQGLIVASEDLTRRSNEQPFIFNKNRTGDHEIGYFVGACHFLSRSKFLSAGGYTNSALYGFEELELSLNLLLNNEKLIFTDCFIVHHKKHQAGREPDEIQKINLLKERVRIASDYYPYLFALISSVIWNLITFRRFKIKFLPKFNLRSRIRMSHLLVNRFLWARILF